MNALWQPDTQAELPSPATKGPLISRRQFLFKGAAALAAVGAYPAIKYALPQHYDMALLKFDPDNNHQLALMHRTCSAATKEATIEPTKSGVLDGSGARTLAPNGEELLVLSPELYIKPNDGGAQNLDGNKVELAHRPSNIFIPYHLFEDAHSFDVRIKTNMEGKSKLVLEIVGQPFARKVPVLKAAKRTVDEVAHDVSTAASNGWENLSAVVDDVLDYLGAGDGKNTFAETQARQQQAAQEYAQSQPLPIAQTTFSVEMDYLPGKVPNLYFFNGRTLDNPTYCMPGEILEQQLQKPQKEEMFPCFKFMPNQGVKCTNGGGCESVHDENKRFFEPELTRRVEESRDMPGGSPEQGFIPAVLGYLSDKAIVDDQLNGYELGALNLGARTQQAVQQEQAEDSWVGKWEKLKDRLGISTPELRATAHAISYRG